MNKETSVLVPMWTGQMKSNVETIYGLCIKQMTVEEKNIFLNQLTLIKCHCQYLEENIKGEK